MGAEAGKAAVVDPKIVADREIGKSNPNQPNWITAHASALPLLEVERLWKRFQQLGCDQGGVLRNQAVEKIIKSDVFMKNLFRMLRNEKGDVTFAAFCLTMRWHESSRTPVASIIVDAMQLTKLTQMTSDGKPLDRTLIGRVMGRVYPHYSSFSPKQEQLGVLVNRLFDAIDLDGANVIHEEAFLRFVMTLPEDVVQRLFQFSIIPPVYDEEVERIYFINEDWRHATPLMRTAKAPKPKQEPEEPTTSRGTKGATFKGTATKVKNANLKAPKQQPPADPDSQPVTDPIIARVAAQVYKRDWIRLANQLGYLSEDVTAFNTMLPGQPEHQVQEMIRQWAKARGARATIGALKEALVQAAMGSVTVQFAST